MKRLLHLICFLFLSVSALSAEPILSEIETDRPDVTESTHAVESGHIQTELNVFSYSKDSGQENYDYLGVNTKYGIFDGTDLQFLVNTYGEEKSSENLKTLKGYDLGLRIKHNIYDSEVFSMALLPFTIFPDNSDDAEYGLAVPFDFTLSEKASLGCMTQVTNINLDPGNGWQSLNTASFAYSLSERLGTFLELVGVFTESTDSAYYFDHGFSYLLTPLVQIDIGFYHGLNSAANDFSTSLGFSFKL